MIRKIKNIGHRILAQVANLYNGYPSSRLKIIGVTGTDGKTTTASLIFHILRTAGLNTSLITTVGAQIGDRTYDTGFHTTTPSSFVLQKYIKKSASENCDFLVLEITSHGLDQGRAHGIKFIVSVLTNVTHEHLDYHKTYENYVRAKARLFNLSKTSILNMDDESYRVISPMISCDEVLSYSTKNKNADFNPDTIGVKFPKAFEFNIENFMAAVSVAKNLGVEDDKILLALKTFKFPAGRQEVVYDRGFRVIVDFAHTPNSFMRVLPALKEEAKGRLIHVFGSAGKRDHSKRPLMGEISAKHSDVMVLTAEDSRGENIEDINMRIKDYEHIHEIQDRQKAIDFAVGIAKKGDIVVVTGKGHEQTMNLGRGEIPWSDQKAVEHALMVRS